MGDSIKIGILLESYNRNLADYEMLEQIVNLPVIEVLTIIKFQSNRKSKRKLTIYEYIDNAVFRVSKNFAATKNIRALIPSIPEVCIDFSAKEKNQELPEAIVSQLSGLHMDVIIQLGDFDFPGQLSEFSKHGVWTQRYFDPKALKTGIPVYWEFFRKHGVQGSVVQMHTKGQCAPVTIFRSWELMNHYSLRINMNKVLGRGSLFFPRILKSLHDQGERYLDYLIQKNNQDMEFDSQLYLDRPGRWDKIKNFWNVSWVILKHITKRIFYIDYWFLLVKIEQNEQTFSTDFSNFIRIDSPKDVFWADPFVVSREGSYFIFVEEYAISESKGHISVLEVDREGKVLSAKSIIEQPYHMAYPFIFEHGGTYYMIPDTCKNKTIELYRCKHFPDQWEFEKVLVDNIHAADTTLHFQNGKWWMFTSIDETGNHAGFDTELFLFYADDFKATEWKAHPCNPIISDSKIARDAGRIFSYNGQLFRPSQYCYKRYGRGFNINRITNLSETEYDEEVYSRVLPNWAPQILGTHTFNFDKEFTVIDAFTRRSRL